MKTIKLRSYVGDDGILRLEIPTDVKEMDLEVTVKVEPIEEVNLDNLPQKRSHAESKQIFAEIQKRYHGQTFSDSAELLREDRHRIMNYKL